MNIHSMAGDGKHFIPSSTSRMSDKWDFFLNLSPQQVTQYVTRSEKTRNKGHLRHF